MKDVKFYIPAITIMCVYLFIVMFSGVNLDTLTIFLVVDIFLLFFSSFLLDRKKWWGCLLGMIMGSRYVYIGMIPKQQLFIINIELFIGVIIVFIYLVFGLIVYIKPNRVNN